MKHMSTGIVRPRTPEEDELDRKRAELARLETELAERELQLASLRAELLAFERRYLRVVGAGYAELDEVEAQIAALLARVSPSDQGAQFKATQARAQAAESQAAVHFEGSQEGSGFNPSQVLRSLYREVAKRVHPDLTTDPNQRARRERLMANANRAYEAGDEVTLRKILEDYENSPELVQGEGPGADLVRIIRKIDQIVKRLLAIERDFEQSSQSDTFGLMVQVEEADNAGGDLLSEMAAQVGQRIAAARERHAELLRSASLI
jgi:hypothetical protein